MKKFIALILLAGAFLGGYYVGRLPSAPDIFSWADKTYEQAQQAGGKFAASADGYSKALFAQRPADGQAQASLDGR